ncbi:hypothetical protein [Ruminococcus sp. AM42-11]|nr:hypothetical protein [Ruminococcus sp. AM42-11]
MCTRHDDGGRITEYGYGYYYATGSVKPDSTMYYSRLEIVRMSRLLRT